jgi:hypothetical protein
MESEWKVRKTTQFLAQGRVFRKGLGSRDDKKGPNKPFKIN